MKVLLVLTLVALAAARPPRGVSIRVKTVQKAARNESHSFDFRVASEEILDVSLVRLKKIVPRWGKKPDLVDTDFRLSVKSLSEEELEEWKSEGKKWRERFNSVLIGEVATTILTCEDQGPYLIQYTKEEEEEEEGLEHHPKPKPPKGFFFLIVKGCKRPKPDPAPRGPAIFVKRVQIAKQKETYEFKFGVAGMKPLDEASISVKKMVFKKGHKRPELVDVDFEVALKTLSEEEIEEWTKDKGHRHRFKHAVVGKATTGELSCEDQGAYLVHYSKERELEHRPHPHPPPPPKGSFLLFVEGCERPVPFKE